MVIADEEMERTRSLYEKKMVEFNMRWCKVEHGQLEVKQNLFKFNNFVREKQGKVEGDLSRVQQEQYLQEQRKEELQELEEERRVQQQARPELEQAVHGRRVFSKYLGSVVEAVPESYKDIQRLMQRCQALVATRCVQCSAVQCVWQRVVGVQGPVEGPPGPDHGGQGGGCQRDIATYFRRTR